MSDDFTQRSPEPAPSLGAGGGQPFGGEPASPPYPVSFEFNGPEDLSRLSTFFRLILAIPLLIFLAVLGGISGGVTSGLILAYWLSALVRGGRPVGWIGSAIVAIERFNYRAYAYLLLLTDKYPAFEGDWIVQLEADRPEKISRRQIFFWKTLAIIPHLICLIVLWFAVAFCEVVGWFAILFTGKFPRGLRNFVVGWLRWSVRVTFYWISLRDEFPPFSGSAQAGPASKTALRLSAFGGLAGVVLIGAGIGVAYSQLAGYETAHVSYTDLQRGGPSDPIEVNNVSITLTEVDNNYVFPDRLLIPDRDSRFVTVQAGIVNAQSVKLDVELDDFELRDNHGDKNDPTFVSVGGIVTPAKVEKGGITVVFMVFEIDADAQPTEFRYFPSGGLKNARFIFDP